MSLAQRFERRLEGLVGGAFARVFKGQVEPVEIGTALQREASDKRNVMGSGQVLCPNRYRVTLSPSDHDRLVPWEVQLTNSLAELVQEYLDENRWETIGDIEVYLARDDELHTGVFGVASRMEPGAPPRRRPHDSLSLPIVPGRAPGDYPDDAQYEPAYEQPAPQYAPDDYAPDIFAPDQYAPDQYAPDQYAPDQYAPDQYAPDQYAPDQYAPEQYAPEQYAPEQYAPEQYAPDPALAPPSAPPAYSGAPYGQPGPPPDGGYQSGYGGGYGGGPGYAAPPPPAAPTTRASLIVDQTNRRFELERGNNVIGRGTDADLQLLDQGISRRHVDVQFDGTFATAYDLGSTNGTTVNGHEISSQVLRHGDVLRVGHTRIVFHQEQR